jgi:hypothetical protein
MTTRRRLTQSADRKASAPPATPGYQEGTNHPAYTQPDPDANQYENGDTSSWAEDPHPGPYPNTPPPATPGTNAPQGHPATDPKHYFPAGVGKEASRNLRAAMEHKAAKCIRIAQAMFGRKASVQAIEDQALDLMNLSDRQIQAMLSRIADQAKEGPEANYTLTPPRTGDDLLADDLLVDDEDVIVPAAAKAAKKSEDEAEKEVEEGVKPEDEAEAAAKKAAHFSRLAAFWSKAAKKAAEDEKESEDEEPVKEEPKKEARKSVKADQNDPATYMAEDDEELLVEMMAEEALKQAKAARLAKQKLIAAKKSEDEDSDEDSDEESDEALLEEMEKEAAKQSEDEKASAKKSEGEPDGDEPKAEDEGAKKEASDDLTIADMLADMNEPLADEDFMDDPMSLMDESDDMGMGDVEMGLLYGGRFAKKSEDEKEPEAKESEEKEPEAKSAAARTAAAKRTAALKPQPRLASTGVKTLGAVSKTAGTSEISDLSKLWESAPDVSKIFG